MKIWAYGRLSYIDQVVKYHEYIAITGECATVRCVDPSNFSPVLDEQDEWPDTRVRERIAAEKMCVVDCELSREIDVTLNADT